MNQPPDQRNETPQSPNPDADRRPAKRSSAVLWLLLLVALLLLGWWWFSQRGIEQPEAALPAATAPGSETATAAAETERAAAEARKRKSAEKPRKPKPAASPRITEPRPLAAQNEQPEYPRDAQRRGLSGRVVLRVDVGADGTATNVDFLQRSGAPELDRAAMSAVRKWRFAPAKRDGKPIASSVRVPVDFVLPKKG
ncbi:energy transducer TonB [Luteimonas gilva]|uniref:Protein TonB n=1 Tax=Luteimonas gilva TaxID=2572684 RepID=A0A4U5JXH0_9GAMM|nr:energy transducer TonB [Luteimonas gilva]TKR33381.1 energy transducer TonB [Luteimonas gilva]